MVNVTVTWHVEAKPDSIWAKLAEKLGREPTDAEVRADWQRILTDVLVDKASKGKLLHQRRR